MPSLRAGRRVDASPADVGRRLTLRYRLDALGLNHAEAVGVLDRWSGTGRHGILMLRRRDDTTVRVPFDSIEAARVLPPDLSAYRMQELAEASWPAREIRDLGAWRLRWSQGHTGRANSVRVAGPADRAVESALAEVVAWYQERGGQPLLQVPDPSAFDELFEAAGWTKLRRSRMLTSSTALMLATSSRASERGDMQLFVADAPDGEWLDLYLGDSALGRAEFEHLIATPQQSAYISCRRSDTGELIGVGRGTRIGEWAGASAMVTAPAARRRGVATAVTAALARWSADLGVNRWFLQVFIDTEAALALYDSIGFVKHHDYVYWGPAQEAPRVV
jgi:GNAT superfamily N-acetyltransferase